MGGTVEMISEEAKMDVKQAVRAAADYVREMESLSQDRDDITLRELRFAVEETRFDENDNTWEITVSFVRPWDKADATLGGLAALTSAPSGSNDKRTTKTVTIKDADGAIISYA